MTTGTLRHRARRLVPTLALAGLVAGGCVGAEADAGRGTEAPASTAENRLATASSPYLLLHKNNPVDWYPWGEEALERARREDKPIFLSVGYSTCHWCHVMARESFDAPEVAAYLNEHFVCIKVDREERPDLDQIYMVATQLITRAGGWPNSVFLTPERVPFFAGTYFPPVDLEGRPGFMTVLRGLSRAWRDERETVLSQAERIGAAMQQVLENRRAPASSVPRTDVIDRAIEALTERFDATWGGFGGAPKFPSPTHLWLLLARSTGADEPRDMLATTLDGMARGGIYDQIGGGFHRYATDARWRVPHFEKMLYDNGLLLEVYAEWYRRTGDAGAARVLRQTAAFLAREMTDPLGGFWSAIDAESDGREGAFYVWTRDEVAATLGPSDAETAGSLLGFAEPPNFEGETYIPFRPTSLDAAASALERPRPQLERHFDDLRQRLLARRAERPRPLTDDKILADWNGLAIAGLAQAGAALDAPSMIAAAERAAGFVLTHLRPEGQPLQHVWRRGRARIPAFLDDYAYMLHGLLALDDVSDERRWRKAAVELADEMIARLRAPRGGFYSADADPDLLFRSQEIGDGARPSGNGVATLALLTLAERTGETRWRDEAEAALKAFGPILDERPGSALAVVAAVDRWSRLFPPDGDPASESVIAGPRGAPDDDLAGLDGPLVQAEATAGTVDAEGWRALTVQVTVTDGWHVNANPASDEYLVATRLHAPEGALRNEAYPPGHALALAFAEDEIDVYDGRFAIHGSIHGDAAEELVLVFQACDDRRCLPPERLPIPIPD